MLPKPTSAGLNLSDPAQNPLVQYSDLGKLVNALLPNLMIGAGIIFFIMMLYAAFNIMNSEGNPEKYKTAKNILTASIIGFGIVFGSFFFVKLLTSILGVQGLPF